MQAQQDFHRLFKDSQSKPAELWFSNTSARGASKLSSNDNLRKDLEAFHLAVIQNIHVALEKWPLFDPKSDQSYLAIRIFGLVKDKWEQVSRHTEVQKHLNKRISIGHFGPIPVADDRRMGIHMIEDILERHARGLKKLTINIDTSYGKDASDLFLNNEVTMVTRAPFFGLDMVSADLICLDDDIRLIRQGMPSDEYDFLTAHLHDLLPICPSAIFEHKMCEKKTISDPNENMASHEPLMEDPSFRRIVLVLRLIGMFNFGAPYVENRLLVPIFPVGYRRVCFTPSLSSRCLNGSDEIGERETDGLQQAWKALEHVSTLKEDGKTKWLAIALEKMNAACDRDNPMDTLLDLCICLEALPTREPQQVTYQFRQRGTFLLSLACAYLNEEPLQKIRKFLGDAYEMRSRLVHGDPPDTKKLEDSNTRLFELARIFCLKSIELSNQFSKDEIINKMDLGMANQKIRNDLEGKLLDSALKPFWNQPYEKVGELFPPEPADSDKQETS